MSDLRSRLVVLLQKDRIHVKESFDDHECVACQENPISTVIFLAGLTISTIKANLCEFAASRNVKT